MTRRRGPRWLPRVELEGNERLAAVLLIGAAAGLYQCWSSRPGPARAPLSAGSPPPVDTSPPASESGAPSASAPASPTALDRGLELCDLPGTATAELNPINVAPGTETRLNPLTGQPVAYRPRKLTPQQREAARQVIEGVPRTEIRKDCYALDLGDGARLVMVGLDAWCETGCRFHAGQLEPRPARLILELATAASMTIDVEDHVFVPAGVDFEHAGASFATTVTTAEQLSNLVLARLARAGQYRDQVIRDGSAVP